MTSGTDNSRPGDLPNAKAQEAYLKLHRAIHEGRYLPGTRLKEAELGVTFKMSRTPIREAIRQLQRDGAVTVTPNRGAVVRQLTEQEIDDTYSLRAVLEGYSASRAAVRMEPMALTQLEDIHAAFVERIESCDAQTEDFDPLIRLNRAFHSSIASGSKNLRVTEVLQRAIEIPAHMRQLYWRSEHARAGALMHHREILDALIARDAVRADAVMRTHIYSVKDFYMRQDRAHGLQRLLSETDEKRGGSDVVVPLSPRLAGPAPR